MDSTGISTAGETSSIRSPRARAAATRVLSSPPAGEDGTTFASPQSDSQSAQSPAGIGPHDAEVASDHLIGVPIIAQRERRVRRPVVRFGYDD